MQHLRTIKKWMLVASFAILQKSQELSFRKERFLRLCITQEALLFPLSNVIELVAFAATDRV